MDIQLYDHQGSVVNQARHELRTHQSVLIEAPTGFGKTVVAAFMCKQAASKGKRVAFICHRLELIDQTAKTFGEFGLNYGFVVAGMPINPFADVYICSVDTLKNRLDKVKPFDLVIWDEAHHMAAAGWASVHSYYTKAKHVGLSATPQRLDGKGLGNWFDVMVSGPSVKWLIANGYLSDFELYSPPSDMNMSSVKTRMGEFVSSDLTAAMDSSSIVGNVVDHWLQLARGRKTIAFAHNVAYSEKFARAFRDAGIPAIHLDAKTKKAERRNKLREFAMGKWQICWNVGLFGEGFDIAANSGMDVNVDCVIDAAPTQSLSAWRQRCGRAIRRKDYAAIILDHAGNCKRHGLPDRDVEWSLADREKKPKAEREKEIEENLRQCPKCFLSHEPKPVCPRCGHVYNNVREIEELEGQLVKMDRDAEEKEKLRVRREKMSEQAQATELEDLIALGVKRGYKKPEVWAAKIYQSRQMKKQKQGVR